MKFNEILFEKKNGLATITLNRADIRNALTHPEMVAEIKSACADVNSDMQTKVLIITATDPAFSAGGNIKDMKNRKGLFGGTPAEIFEKYRHNIQDVLLAVYNVEVPTIAAVNGPAVGGGCGLALVCDIRVASRQAVFGETFINLGLTGGDGSAYTLPVAVGLGKACELIFTGDMIDAETALAIGLVNCLADRDKLLEKAGEIARKIASKPPQALRMTKRLIRLAPHSTFENILQNAAAYQSLCQFTNDHMEAVNAMFEKREAKFTGN